MQYNGAYIKEKWQHAGFQKYLRNTGWMFLGRIFTLVVSFFVGAYIARYLGPADYGLMNYVISFVGLFGFLASLGIDGIVSREIIQRHSDRNKILGAAFFLKIIGSIMTIISIVMIASITTSDTFTLLLIILFSLSYIPQAFNIIETYFQSQVLSKNVVHAQISANIIATFLKLGVILLHKGIFWLLLIYVIESILVALFLLISFKYHGYRFGALQFDTTTIYEILKDSWPLLLSSMAFGIYMKIDQIMVKQILGNEQAGLYSAVIKLTEIWYLIPHIVCTSIFPSIVKIINNKHVFEERIRKLFFFLIWTSLAIIVLIQIISEPIIHLLLGQDFIESAAIFRIYIWTTLSVFISYPISYLLVANNFVFISFINTLIGAITNILLNLLLIPKMGIMGAAIASLISYTLAAFNIIFFKKTRNYVWIILQSILNTKLIK